MQRGDTSSAAVEVYKLEHLCIKVDIFWFSSHHFLAEFLEVGGALTVMEVIRLRGGQEEAKAEALALLSSIAERGRQFKELLCESYGEWIGCG